MMRHIGIWIGIILAMVSIAVAQETLVADLSTPKGAVKAYFNAMRSGDAKAAKAASVFSKEEESLVDAAAAENRAKAKLIAAASKRWGAEETSQKIGWSQEMLVRMVEHAQVTVEGDHAMIGKHGDFPCRRINNEWRFDRSAQTKDEPVSASITRCGKAEEVDQRLAQEIEAGQWKSLDDVLQERDAHIPAPPPPPMPPGFPATRPAEK